MSSSNSEYLLVGSIDFLKLRTLKGSSYPPLLRTVPYRGNLTSRINLRVVYHIRIYPEVASTDYTSDIYWINLMEQSPVCHKVIPATSDDPACQNHESASPSLNLVSMSHSNTGRRNIRDLRIKIFILLYRYRQRHTLLQCDSISPETKWIRHQTFWRDTLYVLHYASKVCEIFQKLSVLPIRINRL